MTIRPTIAVIGAGGVVRHYHLPAYQQLRDRILVAAIVNRSLDHAAKLAAEFGIPKATTDLAATLADPTIDAVDICLPYFANLEVIQACAQAGKHVLCEKPIAGNLREAKAIRAIAERYGIRLMIAENYRFKPEFWKAKELLDGGAIGELVMIRNVSMRHVHPRWITQWRTQDHRATVGYLVDGGVHNVNAMRLLGGHIETVHAYSRKMSLELPGHDTVAINVKYRNGAIGSMVLSYAAQPGHEAISYTLYGTAGTIEISGGIVRLLTGSGRPAESFDFSATNAFVEEIAHFCDVLLDNAPNRMPAEEGIKDLETVLTIIRSIETAAEVRVSP